MYISVGEGDEMDERDGLDRYYRQSLTMFGSTMSAALESIWGLEAMYKVGEDFFS